MAKTGLNQIYDGTTWRTVEPWIYYGGQWHRAITCLYTTADGWIEFTSTSEPEEPEIIIPTIPTPGDGASFAYIVTDIDGAQYGFESNDNGYYESLNKGVHSSYAACRVWFNVVSTCDITFDVINYAEASWDFAQFGTLNSSIELNNTQSTENIQYDFKGKSSPDIVEVVYQNITPGFHFIDIKFIKDSSSNQNNDSVQFKVQEPNIDIEEPDIPDTPDDSEAVWTLYDYTTFTVTSGYTTDGTITWAYGWNKPEKFSNMIREEDTIIQDGIWKTDSSAGLYINMDNTKDDTLHGLHVVTTTPIVVPSTAQKLNIKYFKESTSHIYGYVGIGLISPNETNSFNYTIGEDSYPNNLAAAVNGTPVKETLSLTLPDSIKGTNEYSVVVNFWAESHSAYNLPCTLYCEKIWFSE